MMDSKQWYKPLIQGVKVTVTSVRQPKTGRWPWSFYQKLFVSVTSGAERHNTEISRKRKTVVWDETFEFQYHGEGSSDIQLDLYRTQTDADPIHLGHLVEKLNTSEQSQELYRELPSGHVICFKIAIVYRMPNPPERTFALVIGINTYKSPRLKNLRGCVNDTSSIKEVLLSSFQVPASNIRVLTNEEATRDGIIAAFKSHLINNPSITNIQSPQSSGDTLIFYFAGHGSLADAPQEWETSDGKIETISPHDEWMQGPNGDQIPGIPSRTIHGLFRRLAARKGNNITAIFDCCHSGLISDSRQTKSGDTLVPRWADTPCPITNPHLDEDIWRDPTERLANTDIPTEFLHPSTASHILLAACKHEEVAYEAISPKGAPCGAFTNALVSKLYEISARKLTYTELINYLPPLSGQVPQCGGQHVNRNFLDADSEAPLQERCIIPSFPLTKHEDGTYEVGAGLVHGVVRGSEFILRPEEQAPDGEPESTWVLVADNVQAHSSILIQRPEDSPLPVDAVFRRAVLSNWNSNPAILKVFIDTNQPFLVSKAEIPDTEDEKQSFMSKKSFVRVPLREDAHISISYDEVKEELVVERQDPVIGGLAKPNVRLLLPRRELERLRFILDSIALFRYHLLRPDALAISRNEDVENAFRSFDDGHERVQLHLYRLGQWKGGQRAPEDEKVDFLADNRAEIQCEPGEPSQQPRYGFEIANYTRHTFFPYLFYFDPTDYSIDLWYQPFARGMNGPLNPLREDQPGKVSVGYGPGGGDPIVFVPETGQTRDTGFVKLFVSNAAVDLDHIRQKPARTAITKRLGIRAKEESKIWGTTLAAITAVAAPES